MEKQTVTNVTNSVAGNREALETMKLSWETEEARISAQRAAWEFDIDKEWREKDMFCAQQERARRNIECCLNIIRTQNSNSSAIGVHLKNDTRELAEKTLVELLKQLK
jgi:hypothetical protein